MKHTKVFIVAYDFEPCRGFDIIIICNGRCPPVFKRNGQRIFAAAKQADAFNCNCLLARTQLYLLIGC